MVLHLRDVQFDWPGRATFQIAVRQFQLPKGETALLLGRSGSGKSTLLSLICGTVTPQSGQIEIDGTDIVTLSGGRRDRFRAENIGVIFQQFNLLPFASVADNILLPLSLAPTRRARVTHPRQAAGDLCDALGLPDVLNLKAGTLSVGQQQRVAVARALIGQPPLIIADEPTSALDADTQAAFLELLFTQVKANGGTLLMVSHDARLGDRFDHVVQVEDIAKTTREAA